MSSWPVRLVWLMVVLVLAVAIFRLVTTQHSLSPDQRILIEKSK